MNYKRLLSALTGLALLLSLLPVPALAQSLTAVPPSGVATATPETAMADGDDPAGPSAPTGSPTPAPTDEPSGSPTPTGTPTAEPTSTPAATDEPAPSGTAAPETALTAMEQLLALAETLPDPADVTADNADEVTSQLQTFTQLYAALTADEQETDEAYAALARVLALQSALDALTGEDNTPALLATNINVAYIDATYNEETNTVTYNKKTVSATMVDENTTTWSAGWYVVYSNVTISARITVTGEVHLILANGRHLTASAGINVPLSADENAPNSLTIYAQTEGGAVDDTTGQLTATATASNNAGIGGNGDTNSDAESSGPITIYGGIVKATGTGFGAGIGGGGSNNAIAGNGTNIAIYGGQVTATGTTSGAGGGAGIGGGGGSTAGKGEAITIYGGTVTATGGDHAAGIGGGGTRQSNASYAGSGSNITIHGGTVNATGGNHGAGIGGGSYGAGRGIIITGGDVTANGGDYAAGIGGGNRGAGSGITISGGTVKASSGTNTNRVQGAGIGGGNSGAGSDITISGGTVEATSHSKGAGIGGGSSGAGSNITISGGTVTAISKNYGAGIGGGSGSGSSTSNSITISGGTVTATSEVGGAGIGGGNNSSSTNTVSITGGFVTATGGVAEGRYAAGAAIGSGGGYGASPSTGTELDEENFITENTNAVVLTKSGTEGSTMTGTVYGSYTLAEDVTLSEATTLTIPDGASLTVAASLTMTNNGTITIDAGGAVTIEATGTLVNNGIITNNGTINNNGAIINNGTINGSSTITGSQPGVEVTYQAYDTEKGEFFEATAIATPVTSDMTALGTDNTETWYVVNTAASESLTITNRITVKGNVHLILADGATLTASAGIGVILNETSPNSLTIYGQKAGTGTLTATGANFQAGIGGNGSGVTSSGPITIHGGVVTATGAPAAAGIGGGITGTGNVTIHGGTVTAKGGGEGAGIGGGNSRPGYVTITGGTVTATGGTRGAGIGGGSQEQNASPTTIAISGGTVTAAGGTGAAAIGTGSRGNIGSASITVTITDGFVTAIGGAEYFDANDESWGVGAAIGSGGARDSSNAGAEIAESNFNNAVVLRKSGASGSTMTGQVYGEPTLTTDAEVPAGASLTIPENTSLTIAGGVTLTNGGAICMEGGSLQYGDPYGTLTNEGDGKFYYLLTIEDGSATSGTATYNEKTYATQGTNVTLTAKDQVGLAFNGEWTASPASANVTFTKVDENDETNQNYQFTMPAQPLTVSPVYAAAPAYTVTIPASVDIGGTAKITADKVSVAEGCNLSVKLTGTSGEANAFTLALTDDRSETLSYTVTNGTGESATKVKVNDTILTVAGGTPDNTGTATLSFALANDAVAKYSGTYTGTVTFTVSITEAKSGEGENTTDITPTP